MFITRFHTATKQCCELCNGHLCLTKYKVELWTPKTSVIQKSQTVIPFDLLVGVSAVFGTFKDSQHLWAGVQAKKTAHKYF